MTKTDHPIKLTAQDVRRLADLDQFEFATTADLDPQQTIIGQPRGVKAIRFGMDIDAPGFNIFILGPTGSERTAAIREFIEQYASEKIPSDWVYVYNFKEEHRPLSIKLPPGEGVKFEEAIHELIEGLYREMPQAFGNDAYLEQMSVLEGGYNKQREEIFNAASATAKEKRFVIVNTPNGLMLAPIDAEDQIIPPDAIPGLDEELRTQMGEDRTALQVRLSKMVETVNALDREQERKANDIQKGIAVMLIDARVEALKNYYDQHSFIGNYLDLLREDVLENLEAFAQSDDEDDEEEHKEDDASHRYQKNHLLDQGVFMRYRVNVLVDNSDTKSAPVIMEDLPTYSNLVGRIEGVVEMGALRTDFSMIKSGALHRANGGYLILRVADLLTHPGAWAGLKRALKSSEIRIEESRLRAGAGIFTPQTIEPQAIPLNVKVILRGSPALYYALFRNEEDFQHLFKIKADFASSMPRDTDSEFEYAAFIAARCSKDDLPHFSRESVGRLVEYGARLAAHRDRLSTLFGHLGDVIHEAAYWAKIGGAEIVGAEHVQEALDERRYRNNLLETRTQDRIEEGDVFIDTEGAVIGQVNGLSVLSLGDHAFGQPSRITARVFMGKDGVVNVEREVELSGPIHDKGVLILQGYLGGLYAQNHALTLSASITFEQSYGGVDGDSASSTELYALLSALSGYPIKQNLAVTGSVNQLGHIQPIGGGNEKIEGFFDVCNRRGLTGEQGVILPESNIHNLMLRPDIVEAIAAEQFHIYAISHIDEGIELLTGVPAGERDEQGEFAEGTVHYAVQARLAELAKDGEDEEG